MVKKKRGKKAKKKVSEAKKTPVVEKSLLASAIKDLESGIKMTAAERNRIDKIMRELSLEVEEDRETQKKLERRIAALLEREARLNKRKKDLQTKMDKISDKIDKMSKIRSEMSDL